MFTRTKQRRKSKSTKPSVPDHLARIVIEDSEDSEASLMLNFSDFDDDSFASELIHSRVKHTRGVVKPSIVEISDDPEVIESKKPNLAEEAEFGEVSKNIHGDEAPKDILDLSTCPHLQFITSTLTLTLKEVMFKAKVLCLVLILTCLPLVMRRMLWVKMILIPVGTFLRISMMTLRL